MSIISVVRVSTISFLRAVESNSLIYLINEIFIYNLPINLVAKSATADFVLFNSVFVDAKFVFAVSKSFEVAELPFQSISFQSISKNKTILFLPLRSFLKFSSAIFSSLPNRVEFAPHSKKNE